MSANDKGYMNRSEATDTHHLKKEFISSGCDLFSSVLARADLSFPATAFDRLSSGFCFDETEKEKTASHFSYNA